jgi:voltage-gated potassium channel Kch
MRWFFRTFVNFRDDPSSIRRATAAIVSTIVVLVVAGALVVWLFDREDYPTYASALWFTLQTVTTVGYGDNPPTTGLGQVVASIVMLVSIGLFTVITAAVTSLFIQAVGQEQQESDQQKTTETLSRIEASLEAAHARLDKLGAAATTSGSDVGTDGADRE